MKLFKFFFIFSIVYITSPISQKNDFFTNLNYGFHLTKIKPIATQIKDWNNEIEFYLDNTKIIFSTQKNPYWQITSLQQILKIGKIRNREIKIIDLSIDHPYATFKNN